MGDYRPGRVRLPALARKINSPAQSEKVWIMETLVGEKGPELSLTDRCDACGAAAKTVATKPGRADLMLCGHHSTDHGPAMMAQGWEFR
jgi:hypothetical protein